MKVKQLLMNIVKPINIPITKFILKRHYTASKKLSDTKQAKKVLVFAPHMDDETIGPGGILKKHANEGAEIHCVFVTDGSNSVSNLSKEELTAARMNEIEKVKEILGIDFIHYLGLPDGEVESDEASRKKFQAILQEVKPDMVYTTLFVDAHPDHTATTQILADVMKGMETIDFSIRMYEINCPIPPEFINCVVDITETVRDKEKAMEIFTSQSIAFDGFIALNRLKSNLIDEDVEAIEGFIEPDAKSFITHCHSLSEEKQYFRKRFKQANRTDTLLWAIYKNFKWKKAIYGKSMKNKAR